ncbi:MAG: structural polyprotein [Zhejiang porcine bastro-like virus]|nr:MAG: structural polyprotein [Zhejiang porcine bastro-like virus]
MAPAGSNQPKTKGQQQKKQPQPKTVKDAAQDKQIKEQGQALQRLQKQVKKIQTTGTLPVRERFSCRVNLGIVTGSESDAFCRRSHIFLNPALVKDIDTSTETTPLSIKASQYTMYRISNVELRAHSLAGRGAISGTMLVLALQPDSSQGAAVSFDAVCTRAHSTGSVGDSVVFKPKVRVGRDGWLYTNTSGGEANATLGPSLEAFTFGKSTNLYQNQAYQGPLWRLTLHVTYEFTAYTPNPALSSLGANTESHSITVKTDKNGDILLETEEPLLGAAYSTAQPGIVDAIFSIIEAGAGALGEIPVVGPLLQTGLAFLKPIFTPGSDSNGVKHTYKVCGTFADARLGNAITTNSAIDHTTSGTFRTQQLTAAEVGGFSAAPNVGLALPINVLSCRPITVLTPNITFRPERYIELPAVPVQLTITFNQPVYCRTSATTGGTDIVQSKTVYIPTANDGTAFMFAEYWQVEQQLRDNPVNVVYTDPEPREDSGFVLATSASIQQAIAETGVSPLPGGQAIEYTRGNVQVHGTVGFTNVAEIQPGSTWGPLLKDLQRPLQAAPFFGYHLMYVDYSTTPRSHAFYGAVIVDAKGRHGLIGCYLNKLTGDVTQTTLKNKDMNFAGRIIPSPQVWAAASTPIPTA